MSNAIALILIAIAITYKRLPLNKVVAFFYISFYLLYFTDHFTGLSFDTWMAANIVLDLIVISLCYNAVCKGSVFALLYGLWVVIAYILPEILSINGIDINLYESWFMCVIDVVFVYGELGYEISYNVDNDNDYRSSRTDCSWSDSDDKE